MASMDPETQKYYAALIMEEAARLRAQADKEGVLAYLSTAKPSVRAKPNPQFLKATVCGIAQANRAAEVNEMWKRRSRELKCEERDKKHSSFNRRSDGHTRSSEWRSTCYDKSKKAGRSLRLQKGPFERLCDESAVDCTSEDEGAQCHPQGDNDHQIFQDDFRDQGLHEDEVEQFLLSRAKRGRGTVGSRMDETGPYPSAIAYPEPNPFDRVKEGLKKQRLIGPSREGDEGQLREAKKKHKHKKHKVEQSSDSELSNEYRRAEKKKGRHKSPHKKLKRNKKRHGRS